MKIPPFDLRLSGGDVLLPGVGPTRVDILVSEGKTAGFCQTSSEVAARDVVDIRGLTVFPGAIDPHVHLGQDITFPKTADDVRKESAAAAAGGVTTFLAYLISAEPYEESFEAVVGLTKRNALTDFGYHFCINTRDQLKAIPQYARDFGVSSFKFFMNFRGDEGKYLGIPGNDDGFLFELLQTAADAGCVICPHAENVEIIWRLRERAQALDSPALRLWYESRPPFVEAEALQRVAYLASIVKAPIYAVHVSCAQALNAAVARRAAHAGLYIETCPHYLTHDCDSEIGELGKVNPPLRYSSDREALWAALAAGVIDCLGSDHVPRALASKSGGIWKASAGSPGLETLLPILISEGHVKRGIPLSRIAELTAGNPARVFGLRPNKGAIAPGYDADFAVINLKDSFTIEASGLHSAAGYSIYEGWKVACRVVHTIVRGVFAVRDGALQDRYGHGNYCPRPKSG